MERREKEKKRGDRKRVKRRGRKNEKEKEGHQKENVICGKQVRRKEVKWSKMNKKERKR